MDTLSEEDGMSSSLSINLRRLRKRMNLTQEKLAEIVGISRNAYRSIETGASLPRVSTLSAIAKTLHVSAFDLTADVPELKALRFRSLKTLTSAQRAEREQIKVEVAAWLDDFNDLEGLLAERSAYKFEGPDLPSNPKETARKARQILDVAEDECVPDICGLLESAGIKIYLLESNLKEFFGLSVGFDDGGPAIAVNVEESIPVERRIFTAAHELGHLLLHMESYYADQDEEDRAQENEASIFASYFLMPQPYFERVWSEGSGLNMVDNVLHAKRRFHVSYKTVLRRLIDEHDVDGDLLYKEFYRHYRQRYGKNLTFKEEPEAYVASKDEPNLLDPNDFIEDRLSRLVRKALENNRISISRAAEILNISPEEMRERVTGWEMFG